MTTSTNVGGTDTVTVDQGGNITVSNAIAVVWTTSATGAGVTVNNNGVLAGADTGVGLSGNPAGNFTVDNTGTIQSQFGLGVDIASGSSNVETVTNSGTINGGYGIAVLFGLGTNTYDVTTEFNDDRPYVVDPTGNGIINLSGNGTWEPCSASARM